MYHHVAPRGGGRLGAPDVETPIADRLRRVVQALSGPGEVEIAASTLAGRWYEDRPVPPDETERRRAPPLVATWVTFAPESFGSRPTSAGVAMLPGTATSGRVRARTTTVAVCRAHDESDRRGLVGAGTASPRTVGPATDAACAGRLPGSGARCDTDRFVATAGPFLTPTAVGVVLGVLVVGAVLLVLRALARTVRRPGTTPVVGADGPAWRVTPSTGPAAHGVRGLPSDGRRHVRVREVVVLEEERFAPIRGQGGVRQAVPEVQACGVTAAPRRPPEDPPQLAPHRAASCTPGLERCCCPLHS